MSFQQNIHKRRKNIGHHLDIFSTVYHLTFWSVVFSSRKWLSASHHHPTTMSDAQKKIEQIKYQVNYQITMDLIAKVSFFLSLFSWKMTVCFCSAPRAVF